MTDAERLAEIRQRLSEPDGYVWRQEALFLLAQLDAAQAQVAAAVTIASKLHAIVCRGQWTTEEADAIRPTLDIFLEFFLAPTTARLTRRWVALEALATVVDEEIEGDSVYSSGVQNLRRALAAVAETDP